MIVFHKAAVFHKRGHLFSEFTLGSPDAVNRPHLCGQRGQRLTVPFVRAHVHNGGAAVLQFNGKMALVGKQDAQLLLMIGAAPGLDRGFDEHHPHRPVERQRRQHVRMELVVSQPNPRIGVRRGCRLQHGREVPTAGAEGVNARELQHLCIGHGRNPFVAEIKGCFSPLNNGR